MQDPTEGGGHTKRNKYIIGTLFRFDEVYTEIIRDWLQFLTESKPAHEFRHLAVE